MLNHASSVVQLPKQDCQIMNLFFVSHHGLMFHEARVFFCLQDAPWGCRADCPGSQELLGLGGFFFGYFARFKWPSPEKRTTLAFQPKTNNLQLFGKDGVPQKGLPRG